MSKMRDKLWESQKMMVSSNEATIGSLYVNEGHRGHPRNKDHWEIAIDRAIERLLKQKRRYITPVTVLSEAYGVLNFALPFSHKDHLMKPQRNQFWQLLKTNRPYIKRQLRAYRTSQTNQKTEPNHKPLGNQQIGSKHWFISETIRQELNQPLQ